MQNRTLFDYLRIAFSGFAMGVCEIIPGVSGGTMAFILGIYEELIQSIRDVSEPDFIQAVLKFNIKKVFEILNWQFLITLAIGMFAAILSLAGLLDFLLEGYPALVWSFFFGLVLASIVLVSRRVESWTPVLIGLFLIGAIAAYLLVGLVPAQTPNTWWFLILSGMIAICAMILPGVSGAFILVLMGKYEYVLGAVKGRDLGTIFFVGVGAVLGIITFARVVSWLFEKYPNATIATLAGLMLGSLRKIWPWKESLDFIDSHTAPANVLPALNINGAFNTEIIFALLCAIAGILAIIAVEKLGSRSGNH